MTRAAAAVVVLAGLAIGCAGTASPPASSGAAAAPAPPPVLAAEPLAAEIAPGETHRYRLAAGPGRWLTVEVAQHEADVDARVVDSAGAVVAEAAAPGNWRREQLDLLTGEAGPYRLEIAAAAAGRAGGYRVRLLEDRPARPDDPARREARRRLLGAERASEALLRRLLAGDEVSWSDGERADLLHRLGNALVDEGRLDEADAAFRDALGRLAGDDAPTLEVQVDLALAALAARRGDHDAAHARYRTAVEVARGSGRGADLALALSHLGAFLHQRSDDAAAIAVLREAAEVADAADDAPGELSVRLNLSQLLSTRGDLVEAFAELEHAERVAEDAAIADLALRGRLLRNAGVLRRAAGELDGAWAAFSAALELSLAHDQREVELSVRLHLGALLNQLGEYAEARQHLTACLPLAESLRLPQYRRRALLHLGWSEIADEDPAAAVEFLERAAAPLAGGEQNALDELSATYALAVARLRLGEVDTARRLLEEVAARSAAGGLRLLALEARRTLGELFLEAGEHDRAEAELRVAADAALVLDDPTRRAAVESLLARLAAARGRHREASAHAAAAIELRESVRSRLVDPDLRASYLARWRGDYELAIASLLRLHAEEPAAGHDRQAFERSESAHARTLSELLTEARVEVRRGLAADLVDEERRTARHLSLLEEQLKRLLQGGGSAPHGDPGEHRRREAALRRELDLARQRRAQLERRIRQVHPRYAEIRYPQPPDVAEVQAWLPPGTALLEYTLGERSSTLFLVTAADFAAVALPPAEEIARRVGELRADLERPPSALARTLPPGRVEALTRLLVAPVADRLASVERLIVVPDRDLFYLPFEVLGDPLSGRPAAGGLLRRWTVSYLPSAAVLPHLARDEGRRWERDLRVFADPQPAGERVADARAGGLDRLPGAQREARRIAELFPPGRVDLFVGEAALESRLKRAGAEAAARRLHIASHGVISVSDAASSYVLLGADGQEDGRLHLEEVFALDLPVELVVLSGCETALGPRVEGEGLLGFTRGFLYAGARDLVVSLWPVSDAATVELMVDLYRGLRAGEPPAEALRRAKLARLAAGDAHPFVWAPFVVYGGRADASAVTSLAASTPP